MSTDGGTSAAELAGSRLALAVLAEALVRHDAIAYHQLRETLEEAIAAVDAEAGAEAAVLRPLRQLAEALERAHRPTPVDQPRQRLDWRQLLADIRSD